MDKCEELRSWLHERRSPPWIQSVEEIELIDEVLDKIRELEENEALEFVIAMTPKCPDCGALITGEHVCEKRTSFYS